MQALLRLYSAKITELQCSLTGVRRTEFCSNKIHSTLQGPANPVAIASSSISVYRNHPDSKLFVYSPPASLLILNQGAVTQRLCVAAIPAYQLHA